MALLYIVDGRHLHGLQIHTVVTDNRHQDVVHLQQLGLLVRANSEVDMVDSEEVAYQETEGCGRVLQRGKGM